jgi:hypothetical protein
MIQTFLYILQPYNSIGVHKNAFVFIMHPYPDIIPLIIIFPIICLLQDIQVIPAYHTKADGTVNYISALL